jgi:hypothetical protein
VENKGDIMSQGQTPPTPRESALVFAEGARSGWIASDLIAWMNEHLIAPKRLDTRDGRVHQVVEHGCPTIVFNGATPITPAIRTQTASQVPSLVASARERVIHALRATVRTGETSFVNTALYAGRVARERGPLSKPHWHDYVTEDDALSDQVLALFAADALTHPVDYERNIAVCDVCGAIVFSQSPSRHGCEAHPFGAVEPRSGHWTHSRTNARS